MWKRERGRDREKSVWVVREMEEESQRERNECSWVSKKLFHSMEVYVSECEEREGGGGVVVLSCKGQHHQDFKSLILRKRKNAFLAFHCVLIHAWSPAHVLDFLPCHPPMKLLISKAFPTLQRMKSPAVLI